MEMQSEVRLEVPFGGTGVQIPDPGAPFIGPTLTQQEATQGKRWRNHYEKRARVLAASRKLMAQYGMEGVTIRAVADHCEITPPTVYHLVGDRMQVIDASSAEWVEWLGHRWSAEDCGATRVVNTLYSFWSSAAEHRTYTQNVVQSCASPDSALNSFFRRAGLQILNSALKTMKRQGLLLEEVDTAAMTRQLANLVHGSVCDWMLNPYDEKGYRANFRMGPALMLRGAASEEGREVVEFEIDRIMRAGPDWRLI